jgi:hypothetical protein
VTPSPRARSSDLVATWGGCYETRSAGKRGCCSADRFQQRGRGNPFLHPNNCGPGTNPRGWLLAGALQGAETATCNVPEGKGLLVSPLGNFCSGATNHVYTFRKLRACAFVGLDQVTAVRLRIDDRLVARPNRFFVVSPKFRFHILKDNIFGVHRQTTPAVVIGDFIMIRPLAQGWHTVVLFAAGPFPPPGFAKITYRIHVIDADSNNR